MRIDDAVNIEDLHQMAKRRLPKIAFDYIEGGIEDERGLERNTSAFSKHRLLPRYLVGRPSVRRDHRLGRRSGRGCFVELCHALFVPPGHRGTFLPVT